MPIPWVSWASCPSATTCFRFGSSPVTEHLVRFRLHVNGASAFDSSVVKLEPLNHL